MSPSAPESTAAAVTAPSAAPQPAAAAAPAGQLRRLRRPGTGRPAWLLLTATLQLREAGCEACANQLKSLRSNKF